MLCLGSSTDLIQVRSTKPARSQRLGASVGASVGAEALKQSGAAHSSPPAPSLPVLLVLLVLLRFRVPGQGREASAEPARRSQRQSAEAERCRAQLTTCTGEPPGAPPASGSRDHGSRDRPVCSSPVS
ncbi:hypothetical protein NDU88_005485 [Pleurodeles waltl]|uniref:Uncharacterized protein n=1 Tax=Pleurodeles waltl TaxID=8319 RepID=A0AAV7SLR4_PLEWA|nr:hypothetical protein NDU88_005485 [Pleurodeles waltl]